MLVPEILTMRSILGLCKTGILKPVKNIILEETTYPLLVLYIIWCEKYTLSQRNTSTLEANGLESHQSGIAER